MSERVREYLMIADDLDAMGRPDMASQFRQLARQTAAEEKSSDFMSAMAQMAAQRKATQ